MRRRLSGSYNIRKRLKFAYEKENVPANTKPPRIQYPSHTKKIDIIKRHNAKNAISVTQTRTTIPEAS